MSLTGIHPFFFHRGGKSGKGSKTGGKSGKDYYDWAYEPFDVNDMSFSYSFSMSYEYSMAQ